MKTTILALSLALLSGSAMAAPVCERDVFRRLVCTTGQYTVWHNGHCACAPVGALSWRDARGGGNFSLANNGDHHVATGGNGVAFGGTDNGNNSGLPAGSGVVAQGAGPTGDVPDTGPGGVINPTGGGGDNGGGGGSSGGCGHGGGGNCGVGLGNGGGDGTGNEGGGKGPKGGPSHDHHPSH